MLKNAVIRLFHIRAMISFALIAAAALLCMQTTALAAEVKIGILAKRGDMKTIERWSPLADYLTQVIPENYFTVSPLSFEEVLPAVQRQDVDFILVNSGMYVQLESQEHVERIATLQNAVKDRSITKFGGVVFARADRQDIQTFMDMKGKKIAAVNPASLGGWIAAWREFHHDGLNPTRDFATLDFLGTHDAVVFAVIDGRYDAGTVRTDTLERMARERKLNLDNIRPIMGQCERAQKIAKKIEEKNAGNDTCPFLRSTALYPEWPIARLANTPIELSEKVALALIAMPKNHPAAQKAKIKGWTIPANYQPVHDALLELKIGPYKQLGEITSSAFIRKFKYEILVAFCMFLIISIVLIKYIRLNSLLKDSELKLKTMATHDTLTKLPNRYYFEEFAEKRIYSAERNKDFMGLLFVDLDGFKQVNDTLGHAAGDTVLIEAANRLQATVRKGDLVARCGGDEFLILMVDVLEPRDLSEAARRILQALSPNIKINGTEIQIGASIGIACFPQDGETVPDLLKNADDAMYQVKASGRGHYRYFSDLH